MFAATQGTEPKLFHCSWTMSSQCRNPTKNYPCCVGENKLFELRISISQFEVRAFRLTRVVFWRNLSLGFHHFFQFFHFFQEVKNRWSIWWQWSKESIDHAMDTHIVFLQPLKLQGCNRFCKKRSDQSYQPKMSQHDATPENAGWHSLSSWLTFPFQLQLRHLHRQNRVPKPFITPVQQKEHGECFHSNTISEQIPFIPFFSMAIHKDNIYCILLYIGERERGMKEKIHPLIACFHICMMFIWKHAFVCLVELKGARAELSPIGAGTERIVENQSTRNSSQMVHIHVQSRLNSVSDGNWMAAMQLPGWSGCCDQG